MERHSFHTITLGCKLNQFDTAAIEGELRRRGFEPTGDEARAGVVVINTCTVTHRADSEARRLIRSVRRRNPGCRLLVTGCYAEADREALAALPGVDRVFGNREKDRFSPILDELGIFERPDGETDRGCDGAPEDGAALHFGDRTRAFLKIQQGCRLACAYCIIPQVRGPSRSVAPDRVARGLAGLLDAGHREVVLTGVNSGDYGLDLSPPTDLAALLRDLLAICGPNRIRLNSLEPLTVTDEIISLMAADPRLAPHLQIPLQSGDSTILRRMRRNYRLETYLERVERLRERVPHAGIGADVIVGFPGETDASFRRTCELVERSPLNYLHVFSWSPRTGTPAASMDDRVSPHRIRERSATLRAIGEQAGLRFRRGFLDRELDAIVLGPRADGALRALTGNFIEVVLPRDAATRGEPVRVRVRAVDGSETRAEVVGRPTWAVAAPGKRAARIAPGGELARAGGGSRV
jgi:threonylcarbamoyladenosine tRNA methylthiotransferase MtaB